MTTNNTLMQARLQPADHYCSTYGAALTDSQTIDDALQPAFWAHVAHKLRQGDLIRILPERGDYYALLMVRTVGKAYANVTLLHKVEFDGAEAAPAVASVGDEFEVKWSGPSTKFRVVRVSDKQIMHDGFAAKEDAVKWVKDYIAALDR